MARKATPLVGLVLAVSPLSLTRLSRVLTIWVIAWGAVFVNLDHMAGLSGGTTAMASQKKCKKALWKCAPKFYLLGVGGAINDPAGYVHFKARVAMERRWAGPGRVEYAQAYGFVEVEATWHAEANDLLPDCQSNVTQSVTDQIPVPPVPPDELGDSDFLLGFHLKPFYGKNTYSFTVGTTQPEVSHIIGLGYVSCPADGSSAPFTYPFTGPPLVGIGRGKPGSKYRYGTEGTVGGSGDWIIWYLQRLRPQDIPAPAT